MPPVLVSTAQGVMTITLNRPEKLNAFVAEMHALLREALMQAEDDAAVRALLITGAGRGFCAGQDLSERNMNDPNLDLGGGLDAHYNPFIRRLRALPKPVVCAVNGVAAGAGANIALAGDLVIAARSASFMQAFSKIALVPDCGGTWWLPRLIGLQRAMGMALLAERVSAEDAERWGLIWKCVDDAKLVEEAGNLARTLAAGPTHTFGMIKKALYASSGNTLDEQLDLERDFQREVGRYGDYREGVAAFLEKRKPAFTGR
ncbi:MAG: 2-(1,2-epoxy-1,2-dihydrophenyl)acetyl-CoA isomerase PaaG [Betaproteobacteria bacterium]|nr:2-(1,2-epoxy-1,2-dihydrophenyl)acetyl-CoA isomerase PaaG [Betaproteobacteria bacterium]